MTHPGREQKTAPVGLLPCPFCGGPGEQTPHSEIPEMIIVGCADGDCAGSMVAYDFTTLESAAAHWNTRAALSSPSGGGGQDHGSSAQEADTYRATVGPVLDRIHELCVQFNPLIHDIDDTLSEINQAVFSIMPAPTGIAE